MKKKKLNKFNNFKTTKLLIISIVSKPNQKLLDHKKDFLMFLNNNKMFKILNRKIKKIMN